MKKTTLILAFMAMVCPAIKAAPPVPGDSYDRNSLSVVLIEHGDSYDSKVRPAFSQINYGDKFDINSIPTKYQKVTHSRTRKQSTLSLRTNNTSQCLKTGSYGIDIVSYWFNRKPNGAMDAERVISRGRYNAKDADYLRAAASKTGIEALGDLGFELLSNSYIVFIDYTDIIVDTVQSKRRWKSQVEAHLYRLDYTDDLEGSINACWIYDNDSQSVKTQKRNRFNNLKFDFVHVTSVSVSVSEYENSGGLEKAIRGSYDKVITQLENRVEAWKVRTALMNVKPPRAKIGKKEGVRNRARYDVYEYGSVGGKIVADRVGILRATRVCDNRAVAQGSSPTTDFYQIAGGRLEPGMTLIQKNDIGMSIGLGYAMGGMSGFTLKLDQLVFMSRIGTGHYALLNLAVDSHGLRNYMAVKDGPFPAPRTITAVDFGVGYGFGLRATRHFEFVPNFIFGMSLLTNNLDEGLDEDQENDSFDERSAWHFTTGLRLNINIKYPFQLFLSGDYGWIFGSGWRFEENRDWLREIDRDRSKWTFAAGIRLTF